MASYNQQQASFSPPMYPEPNDTGRPIPPPRAEFERNPQEEPFLPQIPRRMDKQEENNPTIPNQVIKEITKVELR
ncbi:unnamed protein product [Rotaria sp. Silwood2]|nr:unnamed protein product [Rotaria sp. Silwood2]CAF3882518.1 unnamed protein product [Rotaria sp. Silwood2]CAF4319993.1 unnamed protein product [Rotaria sp. Silwood2]CAF4559071.1 unnamed protein product [Rotaria sp. Silwood2]